MNSTSSLVSPSTSHLMASSQSALSQPPLRIDTAALSNGPSGADSPAASPSFSLRPLADTNLSTSASASTLKGLSGGGNGGDTASLSINYIPAKFSASLVSPTQTRRRRGAKGKRDSVLGIRIPKMGGGVDAFRRGEARMGQDEDGEDSRWDGRDGDGEGGGKDTSKDGSKPGDGKGKKRKMRWTKFKVILLIANVVLTAYALITLIFLLLTWFRILPQSSILLAGNRPELLLSTFFCALALFTSLLGSVGLLTNNRSFLALYTFLLWGVFVLLCAPGYITYKKRTFNLEGKLNAQWSRALGAAGRLTIQNELGCCGYFSPFVEATVSQTCYARSVLPGCKKPYLEFQRHALQRWYTVAFALVPVQMAVMLAGLMCSNHVTYRFGKGMMPKAYRLSLGSMAVIMDNYATQLAEQYGTEFASDILSRSRSNLQLADAVVPTLRSTDPARSAKYDSDVSGISGKFDAGKFESGKYELGAASPDTTFGSGKF